MAIEDPEPELVDRVRQLDEAAVAAFLRRYDGLIQASVNQGAYFIDDPRDEEQLQNDVRRAVIEGIGRWNRQKGRLSTWVYGIARNIVNGYLRDRAEGERTGRYGTEVSPHELPTAVQSGDIDPEDPLVLVDPCDPIDPDSRRTDGHGPLPPLLSAFFMVADELPAVDRAVLDHLLTGDPHRQLAQRLGISEDAAKVRASRLRARLKSAMERKANAEIR